MRPRVDAWQAAAGERETVVPLHRLPPDLDFGEGYFEPIRYDPTRKALIYRGLMAAGSYADLRRLSKDPAYLMALDELYVATSLPAGCPCGWRLLLGLALSGSGLLAGAWWLLAH